MLRAVARHRIVPLGVAPSSALAHPSLSLPEKDIRFYRNNLGDTIIGRHRLSHRCVGARHDDNDVPSHRLSSRYELCSRSIDCSLFSSAITILLVIWFTLDYIGFITKQVGQLGKRLSPSKVLPAGLAAGMEWFVTTTLAAGAEADISSTFAFFAIIIPFTLAFRGLKSPLSQEMTAGSGTVIFATPASTTLIR